MQRFGLKYPFLESRDTVENNENKKHLTNYCILRWINLHDKLKRAPGKIIVALCWCTKKAVSSKRHEMLQVIMTTLWI